MIEVWAPPDHQLDSPVLLRKTLQDDVREAPVHDWFFNLRQ